MCRVEGTVLHNCICTCSLKKKVTFSATPELSSASVPDPEDHRGVEKRGIKMNRNKAKEMFVVFVGIFLIASLSAWGSRSSDLQRVKESMRQELGKEDFRRYVLIKGEDAKKLSDQLVPILTRYLASDQEEMRQVAMMGLISLGEKGENAAIAHVESIWNGADDKTKAFLIACLAMVDTPGADAAMIRVDANGEFLRKLAGDQVRSGTLGSLGALRSAVTIYYSDTEGVFPENLSVLKPKYLDEIPKAETGHHKTSAAVKVYKENAAVKDTGGWAYYPSRGEVSVGCTHEDGQGKVWSSY